MKTYSTLFTLLLLVLCNGLSAQIIVLDPGHGYDANGGNPDGRTATEIETALEVGLRTRNLIQANCTWTVYMTRTTNIGGWISVNQRASMSDNWNADRFLSIHCNAGGGTGTETFYCTNNDATTAPDIAFATEVQAEMVSNGSWNDRRCVEDNTYLSYHLGVLNYSSATGCLNEIGFVDFASDAAKLTNSTWRDNFATAYYEALRDNIGGSCSGTCTDNFEANNSSAAATNVFANPLNSNSSNYTLQANIGYSGDQDWYKVNIQACGTLTVNLSNLPYDYDLELYGPNGLSQYLDGSTNSGTSTESVSYLTTSSTLTSWYVKVYPYSSSTYTTASCYNLQFVWTPGTCACTTPSTPVMTGPGTANCTASSIPCTTNPPTITWNSVANAQRFEVYVSEFPFGASCLLYPDVCATGPISYTPSSSYFTPGMVYRTNMAAFGSTNCGSCGSAVSSPAYTFSIAPTISASSNTICQGAVTLTTTAQSPCSGSVTYNWYNSIGLVQSTTSPSLSVTQSGIYYVINTYTGTVNNCSGGTQSVSMSTCQSNSVIISGGSASVSVSPNSISTCTNQSIQLTASGATSYTWAGQGGINGATGAIVNPSYSSTGTYTVTVTGNTNGCTGSATATVTVNGPPATPSTPSGLASVCEGSTQTYSVNPVQGATGYVWTLPGGWSGSSTTNSITVLVGNTGGNVAVAAQNGCGTGNTSVKAVTVNAIPATPQPVASPNPTCLGGLVNLNSNSSGGTCQWTGPTNYSSCNQSFTTNATSEGQYCVVVTQNGCQSAAGCVTVMVNQPVVSISANPNPVCANTATTLTATPGNGSNYQWSGNGVVGNGLAITTATPGGTGTYSVTANFNGCSVSASVSVAVTPLPSAPGSISASSNSYCAGSSAVVTLTVNGSLSGGANWYWYSGSCGGNPVGTGTSIQVQPSATTTYYVRSEAACGNSSCVSKTITVNQPPVINVTPLAVPNPVCVGQTVTLQANNTAAAYSWTGPDSYTNSASNPTFIANANSGGDYCLTITQNGCQSQQVCAPTLVVNALPTTGAYSDPPVICQNGTTMFHATGADTYTWAGTGVNGQTGADITSAPYSTSSVYTVTVTGTANGCSSSATASVTVSQSNTPAITLSQTPGAVCLDGTHPVTINTSVAHAGNAQYTWSSTCNGSDNGNSYTIYNITGPCIVSCTVTSDEQCLTSTTAAASLAVQTIAAIVPQLTIHATSDTVVCFGESVSFSAFTSPNDPNAVYSWSAGSGNFSGTGSTATLSNVASTTSVSCSLLSGLGCVNPATANSNSILVVAQSQVDSPTITISASQPRVCAGNSITFTASFSNGGSQPHFQWKKGILNVGSDSNQFTTSDLSSSDVITCNILSNSSCVLQSSAVSNAITIQVDTLPLVTINTSAPAFCIAQPVHYSATGANSYLWSNGVTSGSIDSSYSVSGPQTITVVGTDNNGCTGSAISTVTINPTVTPQLTLTQNIPNETICGDGSATVVITATPANAGIYNWIGSGTSAVNVFTIPGITSNNTVTCVLRSNAACALPDTAVASLSIQVVQPIVPSVTIAASPNPFCTGTEVAFTAQVANGGTPLFEWLKNNLPVATGSQYSSSAFTNGNSVACVITSDYFCLTRPTDTSNVIVLTENAKPIAVACCDTAVCSAPVQLNGSATGSGISCSWFDNSGIIYTGCSPVVTPTGNSVYSLVVTDFNGCTDTGQVNVTITSPQQPQASFQVDSPRHVTTGCSVCFTSTCINTTSVTWYFDDGQTSNQPNPCHVYTQAGTYNVFLTAKNQCGQFIDTIQTHQYVDASASCITSIGDLDDSSITVSPNPSQGSFTINFHTGYPKGVIIRIFDALGQLISAEELPEMPGNHTQTIDLSMQAGGIYILQVQSGDATLNRKIQLLTNF